MSRQPFYGRTPGIQARGMNMQVATQGARDMARGLQSFGQAVGGMMQKFKAKKEKEEMEDKAEQALIAMGVPPEVAKAGKKDKSLISAFVQNEQLKLNKERTDAYIAGIDAKAQVDAMQKKMDGFLANEQSAKRVLYKEDPYGNTQAQNQYGNLADLVPENPEDQPPGTFSATLKHIQSLHADKETRKAFDNFTGDVRTLFDPSDKNYGDASARFLRLAGDKGPSMLSTFAIIGENQRRTQALAKEDKPFQPPAPKQIDIDGDGRFDVTQMYTTKNSVQYIDARGKTQNVPTSIMENQDIQRMIAEGDVDGLTIAFRNQIRTEEDEELKDVSRLPSILQALIEKAKENQP